MNVLLGSEMYEITLDHPGLNRHRVIRGPDPEIVQRRADYIRAIWDEQWESRRPAGLARQEQDPAGENRQIECAAQEGDRVAAERSNTTDERRNETEERSEDAGDRTEPREQTLSNAVPEIDAISEDANSEEAIFEQAISENDSVDPSPPRDDPTAPRTKSMQRSERDAAVKFRVLDYLFPFTKRHRTKVSGDPNPAPGLG